MFPSISPLRLLTQLFLCRGPSLHGRYPLYRYSGLVRLPPINDLIKEIVRTPFEGTGKPEPLRHALDGYWSRRINDEHRLVYKVEGDSVLIAQARYHY